MNTFGLQKNRTYINENSLKSAVFEFLNKKDVKKPVLGSCCFLHRQTFINLGLPTSKISCTPQSNLSRLIYETL